MDNGLCSAHQLCDDVTDVSFTFLGRWKIFQTSMETPSRVIFELVCSQKRHVCVFYRRLFFNDVVLGKMLFSPEGNFMLQVATWQNWKQGWWAAPCPHYTLYIQDWQAPPCLTTVHLYTCRLELDFAVCQTLFALFSDELNEYTVDKPLTSLFSLQYWLNITTIQTTCQTHPRVKGSTRFYCLLRLVHVTHTQMHTHEASACVRPAFRSSYTHLSTYESLAWELEDTLMI